MFSGRSLALRRGGSPRQKPFDSYMKHFTSRILFCFLILLCASVSSFAQRQTPGRSSVELYGSAIHGYGGGIALSNYGFNGRTVFGLDVFCDHLAYYTPEIYSKDDEMVQPRIDYSYPSTQVLGTIGYLWRIYSNRSRSVVFSGGISVGLGVRYSPSMSGRSKTYDDYGNPSMSSSYSSVGFLCAFIPELQMEAFPARNISMFASFRPRVLPWDVLGSSYMSWFAPVASVGLKYYL